MLDMSIVFSLNLLLDPVAAQFVAGVRPVLLKPISKGFDRIILLANRVLHVFDLFGSVF